jgi:hypothetical protein
MSRQGQGTSNTKVAITGGPVDPVDRLLSADHKLVGLNRLIRRHQRELRDQCSEEAWRTYLRVDELTTELTFSLADLLLKQPR